MNDLVMASLNRYAIDGYHIRADSFNIESRGGEAGADAKTLILFFGMKAK